MNRRMPLVVRLRNFVGDLVLTLPTLQRLQAAGYELKIVGKGWAGELLQGHGWSVETYARGSLARVGQLQALRRAGEALDPAFGQRLNAIAFPFSFSSALEMRLAGLRCLGHANEGRAFLLSRSVQRSQDKHMLEVFWQLGSELLGQDQPAPVAPRLQLSAGQEAQAAAALSAHGVAPGYVVIVPFASSPKAQLERGWPPFRDFVARTLPQLGLQVVICPGPGEEAPAARNYPAATALNKLPLGVYAAVLHGASLVIAGDTGPGHMAAAVGAPTLSLLGPTNPARWGVLGPQVRRLRRHPLWPDEAEVLQAAHELLQSAAPATASRSGTPWQAGAT